MNKNESIIRRVKSCYVQEDCIQYMTAYYNALTILSQEGIMYHGKENSSYYIHSYLEDERREQFPYSNIPKHYQKANLFTKKCCCANQIFEFEKPYIRIQDGCIIENFVVKDGKEALLMHNYMESKEHIKHMTHDELLKLVEKKDPNEQIYYVNLDGSIRLEEELYPTEKEIYNHIQNLFQKNLKDFREHQQKSSDAVAGYLKLHPYFLNYIEESIKHLDLSLINFDIDITLNNHATLLVIRVSGEDIMIQGIKVTFIKKDDFKVNIYDIPVNKYTLEQLKYSSEIINAPHPKIPLKLNPGISKEEINQAKQMVKKLSNHE